MPGGDRLSSPHETPAHLAAGATRAAPKETALAPGHRVDAYEVVRLVGEGGMALVYEIRRADGADEGPLALKVLKIPHRSIQRRLITEGKAQGRLTHPNVVSVKAIVEVEGSPGLVMELVEGIDLDVLLNRGRLEVEAVDQLAVPIIEGVAAAHEAGLIHRDLKPANVLLAGAPGAWVPKIADFGIARIVDSGDDGARATRTGMAMGTPSFMAPEQIRNAKDTDARADVYSLGALLYELVCGRRAFDGTDIVEVLNQVVRGDYVPVAQHAPRAPRRMIEAIEGALETDRERRIPDCRTLLEVWRGERRWKRAESPSRTTWVPAALAMASVVPLGGAVAAAGVLLLLVLAWALSGPRAPPRPIDPPRAARIAAVDQGSPIRPVRTEVPVAGGRPVRPVPRPVVRPDPVPAPTGGPPRTGSVLVSGGASSIRLVGAQGSIAPGSSVPAGRYTLYASFGDGFEPAKLDLVVEPGGSVEVECDAGFKECTLR